MADFGFQLDESGDMDGYCPVCMYELDHGRCAHWKPIGNLPNGGSDD